MSQTDRFERTAARAIDSEVRRIIDEQYARCKALLGAHKDQVLALSNALFKKETIGYPDLKEILGPRPFPISGAYEKFVDTRLLETKKVETEEETATSAAPAAVLDPL